MIDRERASVRAILVLGMHRGGTSALTRVLSLCGATLPESLIEPDPATNETGFWEPRTIVALHDEALAAAGTHWHDVISPPPPWFESTAAATFRQRIGSLFRKEYSNSPLIIVKDPRLCRLMPLWRPVLDDCGIEPAVVIPIRNPLEVAASLGRRDSFGEGKSLLLWLRHFLAAERDSRGMPRCFIAYDDLLTDWRAVIERIGQCIGVAWPRGLVEAGPEIDAFLSSRLRHHSVDDGAVFDRPDLPPHLKTVYEWAICAADGSPPSSDILDRIHDDIIRSEVIFAPVIAALEAGARQQGELLRQWVEIAVDRYKIIEQFRDEIAALRAPDKP